MNEPETKRNLLDKTEAGCNFIFDLVAKLCGWILVAMAVTITLDIVVRELRTVGLIGFNWQFVAEWSAFLVIFMVFAGLAYTLKTDGHIVVNLLYGRLPFRAQKFLALMNSLIAGSILVYMAYRGVLWMMLSYNRGITSTSTIKTPLWIPNSFVVFGLILFSIAVFFFILHQARGLVSGRETRPEVAPPSILPESGEH